MKRFAVLCLILLLLAPAARAEEAVYRIEDQSGAEITHYVGEPEAGDEYIARDNSHYIVRSVDKTAHTAVAERVGVYAMPDVSWLHSDSMAVAADTGRAVAMYCTHSDESYVPTDGESSVTPRGGIYDVATALKENLEEKGVKVYYDDSTHHPHDSGAYRRSRSTAEGLLHDDVDAIFDIHRDGIEDPSQYETTIDGKDATMVRLLVGRSNQNASANKAFAAEIKAVADEMYPELIRDIYIGKGTYNQDLSPRSMLLEFGTHTIDQERAEEATQYMASVIEKTLYGGVSGAAESSGEKTAAKPSRKAEKGAWTGVAWIVGALIVGAIVFAVASTGSVKAAAGKIGSAAREMTGGLFSKKDKK